MDAEQDQARVEVLGNQIGGQEISDVAVFNHIPSSDLLSGNTNARHSFKNVLSGTNSNFSGTATPHHIQADAAFAR